MIKLYIGQPLTDLPHTEILYPNLGNKERETPFGESIFSEFKEPIVEVVNNHDDADYLCIPHNFNYIKNNGSYLMDFVELSEKTAKKIIIFFPGDSDEEINIPNAIIFRNSQYKHKLRGNEIIMPGFAVDLGKKYGLVLRNKGVKPVVGFCGWASYRTLREWVSYGLFNMMESLVGHGARKRGLYFRRNALSLLSKSEFVSTNFITRSSYSGNSKTLTIDPAQARREYVENMQNSDFILSPKGDGNFSVRFFESLSLGRIPVLIDTDCPLPLEEEIDYDEVILRVDYKDMNDIDNKIAKFYESLTPEMYIQKQKKCREVFEKYLKIDVFFRLTMNKDFLL